MRHEIVRQLTTLTAPENWQKHGLAGKHQNWTTPSKYLALFHFYFFSLLFFLVSSISYFIKKKPTKSQRAAQNGHLFFTVSLRRRLLQRGTGYSLYTAVVIDNLNLVTDLVRTYGCGQFCGSVDILIVYLSDNITWF
jgi:hypothetical protein